VVIEVVNTAITSSTVFAVRTAVTITEFTVKYFIVLGRKENFTVVARPLVVIDHTVSRVSEGGTGAR
jgi:hypothetical protein